MDKEENMNKMIRLENFYENKQKKCKGVSEENENS